MIRSQSDAGSASHAIGPSVGITQPLPRGDQEMVDRVLADLRELGVTQLRTSISWADYLTASGRAWYDWLLPHLAEQVHVLPCCTIAPAARQMMGVTGAPVIDADRFADLVAAFIDRLGDSFKWIELAEPIVPQHARGQRRDPQLECERLSSAVIAAAARCRQHDKKVALGLTSWVFSDLAQLDRLCGQGAPAMVDAIGIDLVHPLPSEKIHINGDALHNGRADAGWRPRLDALQRTLARHGLSPQLWITAVGHSTWRHGERDQLRELSRTHNSGVARVYWHTLYDEPTGRLADAGLQPASEADHFGIRQADHTPKLLYRLWAAHGLDALDRYAWIASPGRRTAANAQRPVLITGGAGFIGTNVADHLLSMGQPVVLFDNLSRPGVEKNAAWLQARHGQQARVQVGDVRDWSALAEAVRDAQMVFHFAAQVAVTSSFDRPAYDFDVNARGTINVLEALRAATAPPPLLFTSTNKVYGQLDHIPLQHNATRYTPTDQLLERHGLNPTELNFHSPYGCSKGAADQYVLDYARSFNLPAVVFRMSCIYGPHQFGTEDQGWIAHFLRRALDKQPITLFGDGKQVRDTLFVTDLVQAMLIAMTQMDRLAGRSFNIGGGPANTVSLLELMAMIEQLAGKRTSVRFEPWRPGDQRYYVSDIRPFQQATGWRPHVGVQAGVRKLFNWLSSDPAAPDAVADSARTVA